MSGTGRAIAGDVAPTVFLTGCGRSGTTILGKVIGRHPEIAYCNDRFDLWIEPFPFADIWGFGHGALGPPPRIALDESDAERAGPGARARFREGLDRLRADRRVLVEKVAVNNFRLGFLAALVPGARFINIVRHGVEVARSIARRAEAGRWYGRADSKWRALAEHARGRGLGPLLDHCTSDYARGLLEWRMSIEAAEEFRRRSSDAPWLQVRYEELLARPAAVAASMSEFLGLASSAAMERFAGTMVHRQNPEAHGPELDSAQTRVLAGDALERLGYAVPAGSGA